MELGHRAILVMKTIKMRSEEKYLSPELEVVVINVENGILEDSPKQTEPIIDDPEQGM